MTDLLILGRVLGQLPTGDNSPPEKKGTTITHQDHDP